MVRWMQCKVGEHWSNRCNLERCTSEEECFPSAIYSFLRSLFSYPASALFLKLVACRRASSF